METREVLDQPERVEKRCQIEGCNDVTVGIRTTLCRKHRHNKYKQNYKKKKRRAQGIEDSQSESLENQLALEKFHREKKYASMLQQVLVQKRLELLQSPSICSLLQAHQKKVCEVKAKEILSKRKAALESSKHKENHEKAANEVVSASSSQPDKATNEAPKQIQPSKSSTKTPKSSTRTPKQPSKNSKYRSISSSALPQNTSQKEKTSRCHSTGHLEISTADDWRASDSKPPLQYSPQRFTNEQMLQHISQQVLQQQNNQQQQQQEQQRNQLQQQQQLYNMRQTLQAELLSQNYNLQYDTKRQQQSPQQQFYNLQTVQQQSNYEPQKRQVQQQQSPLMRQFHDKRMQNQVLQHSQIQQQNLPNQCHSLNNLQQQKQHRGMAQQQQSFNREQQYVNAEAVQQHLSQQQQQRVVSQTQQLIVQQQQQISPPQQHHILQPPKQQHNAHQQKLQPQQHVKQHFHHQQQHHQQNHPLSENHLQHLKINRQKPNVLHHQRHLQNQSQQLNKIPHLQQTTQQELTTSNMQSVTTTTDLSAKIPISMPLVSSLSRISIHNPTSPTLLPKTVITNQPGKTKNSHVSATQNRLIAPRTNGLIQNNVSTDGMPVITAILSAPFNQDLTPMNVQSNDRNAVFIETSNMNSNLGGNYSLLHMNTNNLSGFLSDSDIATIQKSNQVGSL